MIRTNETTINEKMHTDVNRILQSEWLTSCSTSLTVRFLPLAVFVSPTLLLLEDGVGDRAVVPDGEDDLLKFFLLYSNARNFAAATESSFGDPFLDVLGDTDFLLGGMMSYSRVNLLSTSPRDEWS